MATKICSRCQIVKPVYEFNKRSDTLDGFQSYCRICSVETYQQWVNNNREHYNEYKRNKTATNPQYQIYKNMHSKLNHILKRGIYSVRTEQILGCNKKQFLDWLVFNFENNMCFTNHGTVWQFDLVNPASAFDLTNEEGLLACFNWRNIRPCIKKDNLTKGNFVLPFQIANQSIRVLAFERKMRDINNN